MSQKAQNLWPECISYKKLKIKQNMQNFIFCCVFLLIEIHPNTLTIKGHINSSLKINNYYTYGRIRRSQKQENSVFVQASGQAVS